MSLNKIISIKNTGCSKNCSASGDVSLKAQNLVFAENGRGKTTFCAVLRSLQSGEPDTQREYVRLTTMPIAPAVGTMNVSDA